MPDKVNIGLLAKLQEVLLVLVTASYESPLVAPQPTFRVTLFSWEPNVMDPYPTPTPKFKLLIRELAIKIPPPT
jgi:hypothetical protein